MVSDPPREYGATFKAQVALAAVKGDKTLAELSEQFHVHPTQVTDWKQPLLARTTFYAVAFHRQALRDDQGRQNRIEMIGEDLLARGCLRGCPGLDSAL